MRTNKALAEANGQFDTAEASVHVDIVVQLKSLGLYRCIVRRRDGARARIVLEADEDAAADTAMIELPAHFPAHRGVRSAKAHRGARRAAERVRIKPGGYIVFDSGVDGDRYRIDLRDPKGSSILEEGAAQAGVLFAITPLVLGRFEMSDEGVGARAAFEVVDLENVAKVTAGEDKMIALQSAYSALQEDGPVQVQLSESGFEPDRFQLVADQPFVVAAFKNTRIIGKPA